MNTVGLRCTTPSYSEQDYAEAGRQLMLQLIMHQILFTSRVPFSRRSLI